MILEVKVDDSSFREWTERSIENVRMMSTLLKEIRVIYYNFIGPLTPLKDGFLQHSLMEHSEIYSNYPFFELKLKMTGLDNPSAKGWDYAEIQYTEDFNHPIQGIPYYMREGFDEAEPFVLKRIETDYLTALGV